MEEATTHQRNVRRAMEGNIAAYFHPTKELIAFLYPSGRINIYNSQTWENVKTKNVKTVNPDGTNRSSRKLREVADMSMSHDGFDRKGRIAQV